MTTSPNLPKHAELPKWVRIARNPLKVAERVDHSYEISSPGDVARILKPMVQREEVEVMWVLCLDPRNHVTSITELTRGILNASLVHAREVFRVAIAVGAASIIVAHNHPSGHASPSPEDRAVTESLAAAGEIIGIACVDHIIITDVGRYFSFAEAGLV